MPGVNHKRRKGSNVDALLSQGGGRCYNEFAEVPTVELIEMGQGMRPPECFLTVDRDGKFIRLKLTFHDMDVEHVIL